MNREMTDALREMALVDAAQRSGALVDGCAHELVRLPIVHFRLDYQCRKCFGLTEYRLTASNASASLEVLDQAVADRVGGIAVGEGFWLGGQP